MKKFQGEKIAIQMLTTERLVGSLREAYAQLSSDPIIKIAYHYFAMLEGVFFQPHGLWVNEPYRRFIKSHRVPGVWLPFPDEVRSCCQKISVKHARKYGGYYEHCCSIKHFAMKADVSPILLRQIIHYYKKLKNEPMLGQRVARKRAKLRLERPYTTMVIPVGNKT